ncbi:hypothetical protein AKJ64_00185 [candidate division MSBL1 archaeon SCGC-AAA259E17]|uniref:Uncharacterized protein n=1 Tax=candidate division MSBL1 archaeon SCGC-AAA259E17 TaxID=1698263 RepID=A0A133UHI2_9EURY|nr:hypothetical protein AKJ64_00185 [candidate division MSBL1 archaeon SCGC-AAA259E17]
MKNSEGFSRYGKNREGKWGKLPAPGWSDTSHLAQERCLEGRVAEPAGFKPQICYDKLGAFQDGR